jgi:peptidoglycan/LPS O-acetylase OafA/YrhL
VIRIYPLYAAAILFSLLPFALAGRQIHAPGNDFTVPHWGQIAANLVLLETIVTGPIASDPVIWTLVVEVLCYLLAPLLARLKTRTLLALTAPLVAAFAFYPRMHLGYYGVLTRGLPLLFLAWPWLAGFIFYRHRQSAAAGVGLIATSVALVLLNQSYGARFAEVTVAFSTFLLVIAPRISLPGLLRRPLDYLGDLSYPLYLFHVPTLVLAWSVLHVRNPWLLIGCAIEVSILALAIESIARRLFFSHPAHAPSDQAKIIEPTAA